MIDIKKHSQFTKRERKVIGDQTASAYAEVMIASILEGIAEGDPELPRYFRWIFNQPEHGMPFSFEDACKAVPFDPDVFREGLEEMYPEQVASLLEGNFRHAS